MSIGRLLRRDLLMRVVCTNANGIAIQCLEYMQLNSEVEGKVVSYCVLFVKLTTENGGVAQRTHLLMLLGIIVLVE